MGIHRNKHWGKVICAAAALGVATGLAADQRGGERRADRFPIDIAEVEQRAIARVDDNGDGAIDFDEFTAYAEERKGRMHGKRGKHGMHGMHGHHRRGERLSDEERAARRSAFQDRVFAAADTDGDGSLSPSEHEGLAEVKRTVRREAAFERLDADGNGSLTVGEYPPHVRRLRELDEDGDGMVTRDEMPRRRGR